MSILLSSNYQWVLLSTLLLGFASGLIGCLVYWRKQSLMSDALSHAALPGVVISFLIFQEKDFFLLIIGATISALLGAFLIMLIKSTTRITSDTAMGLILAVFFGGGIVLLTVVNRNSNGNQAGLDSFIYGQAASMIWSDVVITTILAATVILIILIGFKEWKLLLFDPNFAKGLNLSIKGMNTVYLIILVLTIVIGIQAVGVILMSALLIIPPVSARYWTHSFRKMMWLSGLFGGMAGTIGTTISALGSGWPTGPFIVMISGLIFLLSLFFGAKKGIVVEYLIFRNKKNEVLKLMPPAQIVREGKR
ncbi:metal ABC transporter permease [Lysinibacillus telephonicus]|uniref:Metal ABC transporter permease n=1 Tax=Lysinibacillus telephonicus TaxID=1714840 RepID=A0A3S0HEB6_9BACI|nr:metal ABC transporter permease [Lysinibacillus telephonicus]RTQ88087.1 metal ABC transporter permease [Lysinibacillus telephonicus]